MGNEIKDYLKKNLELEWKWYDYKCYLCLVLDGEVISKVKFEMD